VNGDRVSLVSVEQVRRYGWTPLQEGISNTERERQLPADLKLPRTHVFVHDANGTVFTKCEIFIVRWYPGASGPASQRDIRTARAYFGEGKRIRRGHVEVPERGWMHRSQIAVIRYHRDAGPTEAHVGDFEHRYEPPVRLYACRRPLAWKISLPQGCIITAHGFERP
jgi:hypothetical protein